MKTFNIYLTTNEPNYFDYCKSKILETLGENKISQTSLYKKAKELNTFCSCYIKIKEKKW